MNFFQRSFVMTRNVKTALFDGLRDNFFVALACIIFPLSAAVAAPGAGGPDTFGYQWKDSDESGGPSFNYIDISSSGTAVTVLADDNFDGPFPIGFTFNFYGTNYTEFYVASNGFIGFGPTTGYHKFTNVQPPITTSPNNIIAWLWDDLIPRNDSGVYYQSFADKLVIQFVQFGNNNSGAENERVNAEVILYPNGKILIQYLNFTSNWPFSLCTVGLENADGTDGLTVVHNAPYLHNALAVQITSATSPPDAPALSSPANNATSQSRTPTLKWNASTGATSYRLQVATDNAFTAKVFDDSTLTGTSKQIGPLAYGTTYFWRVKAKNENGASAWSTARKFTTQVAPPAQPTLVSPANGASSQPTTLTLQWNASAGAATYRLQVATDSTFSSNVFDDSTITTTSQLVGPLANSTAHFWRVKAKNNGGMSAWSQVWKFITKGSIPAAPVLVSPANGATLSFTTVNLQWNASAGAASYRLQVATDSAFTDKVFDDSTITATLKQIGPLANFETYYWRVNAKNVEGTSAWSPSRKFTIEDLSQTGAPISAATKSGFLKSNQSKVFYHDSQWWALACNQADGRWYIWRYNSGATWVKTLVFTPGSAFNCDAVINPNNGKLYVFGSHKTTPSFWRFSYFAGTWKKDSGYPVAIANFTNADQNNPVSLARAKNGEWWIFRIENKILQARLSQNDGLTWSPIIEVKTGLTTIYGTTDAVAFSFAGDNFIGVAYGERDTSGSKYGFLRHRDGDPETTWHDESSSLTFFGNERALNNICLTTDGNDNLYLLTRNNNAGGKLPRNTLYKRNTAGAWQKFKVNSSAAVNWKTPAIAIDKPNNRIYCFGVNASTSIAEYKTCQIGQESTLDTAAVQTLFSVAAASFDNLSVPASTVTGISGLLVCGDNTTAGDIWFRYLPIPPGGTPLTIGAVAVASNEVNANATYTIPLTLASAGALTANNGVLHFRFPGSTLMPDSMAAGQVLVNGVPATKVVANNGMKQVRIITPVNLGNNQSFSVVFNSGAGLLNPTLTGSSFALTAWTSAQPAQVSSPNYSLVPATTTVTSAAVTISTQKPGAPTDYTLAFKLGDHGRMLPGSSKFTVKFADGTHVTHGAFTGVTVNAINAVASGDSIQRKITITLPATVTLGNNAAVTLFLPGTAITNPVIGNTYTLTVATTVETAPVNSNPFFISSSTGQPIFGTTKNFDRNNQSKMFYHGGNWWVTAQSKEDLKWYLWKFDGSAWTKTIQIYDTTKPRPDCVVEASINKAFILLPGTSPAYILRLSYASGNWTIDNGYPYPIPDFVQNAEMNLVRAANGQLWVFAIDDSSLVAKRSSNGGQTWSGKITIKSHLNNGKGLTDAVKFAANNANHIGVGYAENSGLGSIYGFLYHKDSDPETAWTDETGKIPQFAGTVSDNHISMLAYSNNVLMIVKTNGGGPNTPTVGLFRRAPNGTWSKYPILLSQGWTRPTMAIDQTNNRLYVIGTRENGTKVGEMKNVTFGDYKALLTAPIDTIFVNETDSFFDISVAAHWLNGAMNLLICTGNLTREETWYNLIDLAGASKAVSDEPAAATIENEENLEGVQTYPNPFNPDTFFRFEVPKAAPVKLYIFNLGGQLVRTLVNDDLPPGVHQRRWQGRNNAGYPIASGVYLYRLQVGEKVYTGRVQMIK